MKRSLSFFLSFVMVLCLVACGGTSDAHTTNNKSDSSSSAEKQTNQTTSTNTEQTTTTTQPTETESSFEPFVILYQDGIKITVTGYWENNYEGELSLLVENFTDKNIILQSEDVVANGFMVGALMSVDVAAGKKANDSMQLRSSSLQNCDIEWVHSLSFKLIAMNENFDRLFESEIIDLFIGDPGRLNPEYTNYDSVIYEANGIKICAKGIYDMGGGDLDSVYYIENNTENDIVIQADNVSINGFMVHPIFSVNVVAGAKAVDGMSFRASNLQENNIQMINNLEFTFRFIDFDNHDNSYDSDIISIDFG